VRVPAACGGDDKSSREPYERMITAGLPIDTERSQLLRMGFSELALSSAIKDFFLTAEASQLALPNRVFHRFRMPGDHGEQNPRRSIGTGTSLLPVAQRRGLKTELCRESGLA
jgi:hypothetical protein